MEKEMKSLTVDLEILINAKKEQVWDALVNDIGQWWRKDFYVTDAKNFVLEPKLGGKMYEDSGNGSGLTWYNVQAIAPNESIMLSGFVYPEFGGPATTLLKLSLQEENGKTTLKISDSVFGHLSTKAQGNIQEGWSALFAEGLKPYAEKKASN